MSAEAGFGCFMDFLERGLTRDFRDDALLLEETGVVEGLEGGLAAFP
jgi:hypothetical protein